MSKIDSWVDNKIVQNITVWFFLFIILLSAIHTDNKPLASFFIILLLAPGVYINNLVILPFLRKNKLVFFLLFLSNTLVFSIVSVVLINTSEKQNFEFKMLLNFLGIMILVLVSASAIKIARDSFSRRQKEKEAELKLLKAQLNPHFLFNTLNNLYGLSVVKSDKLPGLMLKLSDLLRYSLYETKESFVPLKKEIQYLENYISLEKIRLEDKTTIQFKKNGDLYLEHIAPMLLIVFVENAFKHIGFHKNEKSYVSVSIHITNSTLNFECINSIDNQTKEESLEIGKSSIGLQNAKKRLYLLYPNKHKLKITKTSKTYLVKVTIDL